MLSYMLPSLHLLRINALLRVKLDWIGPSLPAGGLEAMGIALVIVILRTGFTRLVSLSLFSGQQPLRFACNLVASSEILTVPNSTTNGNSYRSAISSQQLRCN